MCAICGIFNINNTKRINPAIVVTMLKTIRHRGPDGGDMFVSEDAALGFNRLSFLDSQNGDKKHP